MSMEDDFIQKLSKLNDEDFFEVISDFIYQHGEDDFAQRYPDEYIRYLDLQDMLETDDDDDSYQPKINFNDLYKESSNISISAPSFSNFEASIIKKPLGGIFRGANAAPSPITNILQNMRNGGIVKKYNSGGNVSPAYSRYMTVGNGTRIDGIVPVDSMIPIQTEEGELIVHPTMDVTKVNAKKRHSKLGDNEVTDIVPEGSYVLSRHGVVRIYKDEADKAVIETQNKPYSLFTSNPQPKVKTLGDMMKRKEMSPAELARDILNKYKVINHDDPFTDQTNKANKYNSGRYIKSIIELSEFDKARKGLSNGEEMNQMFTQEPDMWAKNGGFSQRKYAAGALVSAGLKLLPAIGTIAGSIFGNASAKRANQRAKEVSEQYAKQYGDIMGRANRLGFLANISSTLGQDPTVQVAKRDSSYLQGLMNRLGSTAERNAFMQDLAASSPDLSKFDPRASGALGAQLLANQLRSVSDFNVKQSAADRAAREKYTGMMAENEFFNRQQDVQKSNQEAMNRNRLLSLLGAQGAGYAGTQGAIGVNQLEAMTGAQKDSITNEAKRSSDLWSNLLRGADMLATPKNIEASTIDDLIATIQGIFNKKTPSPTSSSSPLGPYNPSNPSLYSPSGKWQDPSNNSWGGYRLKSP